MQNILVGVTVVTLATNLPGPLAAARLTQRGAAVTKVEPPAGDPMAAASPAWYAELTKDQQVVTLDLKSSTGRAELDRLLTAAGLLITAMRPSATRRLGLADAPGRYHGLSHIEIVGHDGEHEERSGHDLTYQASKGTLQPPAMPSVPVVDLLGAERTVSEALLALIAARRTGVGQIRRVVLEDAAEAAGAAMRYGLMGPGTLLGGGTPTYRIYESADGHVALGALEPHFCERALSLLGVENRVEELARAFATRTTDEWERLAAGADVPLVGVSSTRQGVLT